MKSTIQAESKNKALETVFLTGVTNPKVTAALTDPRRAHRYVLLCRAHHQQLDGFRGGRGGPEWSKIVRKRGRR